MRNRDRAALLAMLCWAACAAAADTGGGDQLLDLGGIGRSKEPVTITAERLEYDYKANVVVYRGAVEAVQGAAKLRADTLTVHLGAPPAGKEAAKEEVQEGTPTIPGGRMRVQEIVAVGNVRIDQGSRWATGGRAVFDQAKRTFVLTESPVMHDGPNEVAGDTVTVFLDENRSVVDGGQSKRVKAVLHPDKDAAGDRAPVARAGRP